MTKVVFLSCISNEFCKEMVLEIAAPEERPKYHILRFWYISSLTFCQTLFCFQFHLEEFSKMLHAVFALLLADSMTDSTPLSGKDGLHGSTPPSAVLLMSSIVRIEHCIFGNACPSV